MGKLLIPWSRPRPIKVIVLLNICQYKEQHQLTKTIHQKKVMNHLKQEKFTLIEACNAFFIEHLTTFINLSSDFNPENPVIFTKIYAWTALTENQISSFLVQHMMSVSELN